MHGLFHEISIGMVGSLWPIWRWCYWGPCWTSPIGLNGTFLSERPVPANDVVIEEQDVQFKGNHVEKGHGSVCLSSIHIGSGKYDIVPAWHTHEPSFVHITELWSFSVRFSSFKHWITAVSKAGILINERKLKKTYSTFSKFVHTLISTCTTNFKHI